MVRGQGSDTELSPLLALGLWHSCFTSEPLCPLQQDSLLGKVLLTSSVKDYVMEVAG